MGCIGPISTNGWTEPAQRREHEISKLAERQHGVVALRQLRELGLSESAVRSRVTAGRLHRIHAGVFALGHRRLSRKGHWMAAVLACGRRAVLSHRSAAALWGIRFTSRGRIDVISVTRAGKSRTGIDVHRPSGLVRGEVTDVDGIPVTTVARTLLDLATVIDRHGLEKAINEAEVLGFFDRRAVERTLERAGRRRGTRALRATLTNLDPLQAQTRNELEHRFLTLCRRAKLPRPEVNAWIGVEGERLEADFLWREQRVIVETDGYATHSTRRAFERDRRRDLLLLRADYRTVRVTWRQVSSEPRELVSALRALLS